MRSWKAVVILAAMTGCASFGKLAGQDTSFVSGRWNGSIDREDGWWKPIFLDVDRDHGVWHGTWQSRPGGPSMAIKELEAHGDEVRFETGKLRFVGHVAGETLSGRVIELPAETPAGEFTVTLDDPARWMD